MTSKQKQEIQKSIDRAIFETQMDIDRLTDLTRPISPENAIGRVSRMDAINNKSVNEHALRNAKNKLLLLESALERIPEDNFGSCIRCAQQIPIKRILLLPQSNHCVYCASR